MNYQELSLGDVRTQSARGRHNLVRIDNLLRPGMPVEPWDEQGFDQLVRRIIRARQTERPVIWSLGAHVVKCGLGPYLIALMRAGIITHIAGNGACSIHDFELAFLGGTSEDVPTAIEDGSFGMWEETGLWMNQAIRKGAEEGRGYGEALAVYMHSARERFPHLKDSYNYQAWALGVPSTFHIALGTDIIHQHPACDFGAIGKASQRDFLRFCHGVSRLEGGVFINFGSSVIGPEVFLKALSIARNLGHQTFEITTANFDLKPLADYRAKVGQEDPDYYYRPRKNIVNRPVSRGGKGWHFTGDHRRTIPALYQRLKDLGWPMKEEEA